MNIVEQYINGLEKASFEQNLKEDWEHFEKVIHGATQEDITKLQALYPAVPASLVDLLTYVDGTYWREYGGEEIAFYFLGSDIGEYPYYLLSAKQMMENKNIAPAYYPDYIERAYDEDVIKMDDKITTKPDAVKWLHFSDCMNNGGTSQLFIDFSPSAKGKAGQVLRFLHDPDGFKVIADSFESYLQMLMNKGYDFIF